MSRKFIFWVIGVVGVLVVGIWAGGGSLFRPPAKQRSLIELQARVAAPEALLRNLEGALVKIPDGQGNPVLVVFWASW